MSLIDAAFSRSRTVLSLLALVLIAGLFAYVNIAKEAQPDIAIPNIYVSMILKGISPEDADRLLVRPMDSELRSIEGVKEIRSNAFQGGATILLEFEAGFDADKAIVDVRERVDAAQSGLPDEADRPEVIEINLSLLPVVVITLGGEFPERTMLRLARNLKERIEDISNVLEASVGGDRKERVEIIIDPLMLESYAINPAEVLSIVRRSNRFVAAGSLESDSGSFAVKVPGPFESFRDVWGIPLKASGDSVVTVGDIASVRRTFDDRRTYARLNGRSAISLEVKKRAGENIIDTVEAVKAVVAEESARWPEGVEVEFSNDESHFIRIMLTDLQNNVLAAVLLVMIIVAGTLGLRTGLLVGIAIPGSFLAGVLVLAALGLTVNMVVLFSLILSVGLLVDGAIVVTEYADRKMIETASQCAVGLQESRRLAYAAAARRMAWPIIASTATTLAAFLPLLFWPGVIGEFMRFLPITLIAVLSASLAMALIFVPTLGAQVGMPGTSSRRAINQMIAMETGSVRDVKGWTGIYVRLLEHVLRHPAKVALLALCCLIAAWTLYANFGRGFEFFPKIEPDRAVLKIFARGNMSVDAKAGLVRDVERQILDLQRERGELKSIYILSGHMSRQSDTPADLIGTVNLELADWRTRRKADEILADIVQRSRQFAGIRVETVKEEAGPPVGKPINMLVSSRKPELLAPAVARIRSRLENIGGLKDIEDDRRIPGIEWELSVDRSQAFKFGADVALIGEVIRLVTSGFKVADYRPDDADDEVEIVVRYPEAHRTLDQLDNIRVQTSKGLITVSNFLTRAPRPKTGDVKRIDSRLSMSVKADVLPGVLADDKVREIRAWIENEASLGDEIDITFKGEDREQKEAAAFLQRAFAVALFLMAIILVTQFNRFYSAFLILSAVVMSTSGVMLGLLIIAQPFSVVMSGIGVIALAGIVVNNNIVLIDTFDRLAKTASTPTEAILRTGTQRLRPVLLTTATTILGLTPMVTAVNIDFITREISVGAPSTQIWRQLATAVAFGLAFATLLTLLVTPALLMIRANVAAWRVRRRRVAAAAE